MSFSGDLKNELATVKPEKSCCGLSELCGLYATMGSLSLLGRGKVNVQLTSESLAVCRRAYTLLAQSLQISPQIHYVTNARFGGTRKCVLTLGPIHSPTLLKALGIMDESGSLRSATPRIGLTRQCCMRAFLRGIMLGGGTMSNPEQSYHLELPARDGEVQNMTAKCMQRMGLPIKLSERREHTYFYLKQSDQIVAFLTVIGAHTAVMQIEDLRVKKQVMETVNLSTLPPGLQEIALARMNNPDASLTELGQMLDPPIGKSGVNHRMRRLMTYLDAGDEA